MRDTVRCRCLNFDRESRKLIGVPLLHKAGQFCVGGLLDLFEMEAAGLLPECQIVRGVVARVRKALLEFVQPRFLAAIERGKPSGKLFAGRSFGNFDSGRLGLGNSCVAGRKTESRQRECYQKDSACDS